MTTRRLIAVMALITAGCAHEPPEPRIDSIPMYGQPAVARPEAFRQADEDFIRKSAAGFGGDRKAASRAWYAEGDRFLRELNLDYAMRRYNQSWLLDPDNYQPYWGFARVLTQTDRFTEAIEHFNTAKRLCNDNYQKVALLSDAGTAYSYAGNFQFANQQFSESTTLDAKYPPAWLRWSQSLYREGNYGEAWSKLREARSLGATIPEAYVRDLSQKMPEPR